MKAVICQINSKYVHSSLAAWYIAEGIDKYSRSDISYAVVEGTINEPLSDISARIASEKPDIAGFSCYIWNIESVVKVAESLKKAMPDTRIVLGGPEVSYNICESFSLYTWCDYIISGEGEKPFAYLCDALNCGTEREIEGVYGSDAVNSKECNIVPFSDKEDPPSPYSDNYFNSLNGRIAYLETSRGCPFRCAFCLSGRIGGVRYFDFETAKRNAVRLANSGTKTIKLVDRTFNANIERAKDFWKFIISECGKTIPENVCFHFEIAGDLIDEETVSILGRARKGFIQLEIGLQSFNTTTLNSINRKTNLETLSQNILKLVGLRNMNIHIDLIAGLPYEGPESFRTSFNRAYELYSDMLQLGFLKLLHGADMREIGTVYPCKYRSLPPYEIIENEWVSRDYLNSLHNMEDALERLYNSGRFKHTMDYSIRATGREPYDIYFDFGQWVKDKIDYRISLDDYSRLVYDYFSRTDGIDQTALKNCMIIDRLSSNSTGRLPEFLKSKNTNIKKIRGYIESLPGNEPVAHVKRGFALLFGCDIAVFADYKEKDPVTGSYRVREFDYSTFTV